MGEDARRVSSHEDLLAACGGDPFVRYAVPSRLDVAAYALGGAVAFVRRTATGRTSLMAFGPEPALSQVLDAVVADDLPRRSGLTRISVPSISAHLLAERFRVLDGDEWEWMWTTSLPSGRQGEKGAVFEPLDDRLDAAELASFLERVSPSTHATPGSGAATVWLGLRRHGRLVVAGASELAPGGYPLLSGIAVEPSLRGQGLGSAVTAELTRRAVGQHGACTLGMFSSNAVARRLYLGLGYRVGHAFASWTLAGQPAGAVTERHTG